MCLCYVTKVGTSTDKLDSRAVVCVFLGYPFGKKGYRVMDLNTKKTYISRDVYFIKDKFPFSNLHNSSTFISPSTQLIHDNDTPVPTSFVLDTTNDFIVVSTPDTTALIGRPCRHKTLHSKFMDYTGLPALLSSNSTNHVNYPLHQYMSYHVFRPQYVSFLTKTVVIPTPYTYSQTIKHDVWCKVMKEGNMALEANNTWKIVPMPSNTNIVDCKWLYKVKYKANGEVERYKARLVAKGFTQTEGLDYFETFAPVAKMTTVRILLALAAAFDWKLHQMDVTNAFLHGDLHEDVFMRLPPGLAQYTGKPFPESASVQWVCKLIKSLYGLRQSPRMWYLKLKLANALAVFGLVQCPTDHSLFTLHKEGQFVVVLVYVDDLMITGSSSTLIAQVQAFLKTKFNIKDLGHMKYFLGLEIARSDAGIYLYQHKYCLDILKDTCMLAAKPSLIPIEQNHNLQKSTYPPLTGSDIKLFRRLVGRLIYLTITRPDLSYAVHTLAQFIAQPLQDHLEAAYRVVRYLKHAPAQGLFFPAKNDLKLQAYSVMLTGVVALTQGVLLLGIV